MDLERDNYQAFFEKLHSPRNLSQIFEDDNKLMQSETKNLRYQPQSEQKMQQQHKPKTKLQRNSKPDSKTGESWTTLMAVVAEAYKGNDAVGRVGLALLRNEAGAAQLMVYKNGAKVLSRLLLTKSTESSQPRIGQGTVIMRQTYLQFFDDEHCFWSLHIELAKDEERFTQALTKLGMNLDETAKNLNDKSWATAIAIATSSTKTTTTMQAESAVRASNDDSESESAQYGDDIITTYDARAPMAAPAPVAATKALIKSCSAVSLPRSEPQMSVGKLEIYLDEQRATGHSIDKKMEAIMQALCRLTGDSNITSSSVHHLNDNGDSAAIGTSKQIDSLLQARKLMQPCNDNDEDELLELEQKLLDLKKENRALLKSLRVKEQAFDDLRTTTGALCQDLVSQNTELRQQNTSLIAAMSTTLSRTNADNLTMTNCSNCEQHLTKIAALETRLMAMQNALLKYTTSKGATASPPQ
ncbi:uncharacterized protein LOC6564575 isoform X2 [Drosophila grimshawi]|uniref:uncharacterized protein LOC6564575 isoform X2 n=1 Tax=Drosophila grimshawi TaxID=7222 RepID=UPI000C86F4EC|nr:uncharacterized protein LOC6564575 isoform X2 [Drosophila grimshawi]